MHHHYNDIRSRIPEPPTWWDEHAVPRYGPFRPDATADIYADEVALVEIACQNCGQRFPVAFTTSRSERVMRVAMRGFAPVDVKAIDAAGREAADDTLAKAIRGGWLHYGDPPNACCASGATMNCDDLRVLEYWHKPDRFTWVRDTSLEIKIE